MKKKVFIITAVLFMMAAVFLTGCASDEMYTLRDEAIEKYKQGSYAEARMLFVCEKCLQPKNAPLASGDGCAASRT